MRGPLASGGVGARKLTVVDERHGAIGIDDPPPVHVVPGGGAGPTRRRQQPERRHRGRLGPAVVRADEGRRAGHVGCRVARRGRLRGGQAHSRGAVRDHDVHAGSGEVHSRRVEDGALGDCAGGVDRGHADHPGVGSRIAQIRLGIRARRGSLRSALFLDVARGGDHDLVLRDGVGDGRFDPGVRGRNGPRNRDDVDRRVVRGPVDAVRQALDRGGRIGVGLGVGLISGKGVDDLDGNDVRPRGDASDGPRSVRLPGDDRGDRRSVPFVVGPRVSAARRVIAGFDRRPVERRRGCDPRIDDRDRHLAALGQLVSRLQVDDARGEDGLLLGGRRVDLRGSLLAGLLVEPGAEPRTPLAAGLRRAADARGHRGSRTGTLRGGRHRPGMRRPGCADGQECAGGAQPFRGVARPRTGGCARWPGGRLPASWATAPHPAGGAGPAA